MIRTTNNAVNLQQLKYMEDFTIGHYRKLIRKAKENYNFVSYSDIVSEDNFILWRHDCDFSLNRAYRLACIESAEGVCSTYFINPHSEFYNPFEKKQAKLIADIINEGHSIGLHFDGEFYKINAEDQLDDLVANEVQWLNSCFGIHPRAFSFHNPSKFLLSCEKNEYGGLLNCYSSYFKSSVSYCSDSNGYWRFRRLWDVLESADDQCLQVLTHPGWWQNEVMFPHDRVLRAVEGRAQAIMQNYDSDLVNYGRLNISSRVEEQKGEGERCLS